MYDDPSPKCSDIQNGKETLGLFKSPTPDLLDMQLESKLEELVENTYWTGGRLLVS